MKIFAEIPARAGSQRVKNKNMRLLNGKPMIHYAIEAAKASKLLTAVYVNTDSEEIGEYALGQGVQYYKRQKDLASDHATSDEYNYDFFQSTGADILVQVNPVCPFVTASLIDAAIREFNNNSFDSLVTVREEQFQAFHNGEAINFDINKHLPRTQDILPIQICAWPVSIWRKDTFMKSYRDKGHAVFSGKISLFPVSFLTSIKVSYERDFVLAEKLLQIGYET
jgi:CMP-N-acetylneuraminic acid synthetase